MNEPTNGQQPDEETRHSLRIEDAGDPIAWRAYSGYETTIADMFAACSVLGLRCWVDLDGQVCLIIAQTKHMPAGPDLPDCEELARAMWGLDSADDIDHVTRQSHLPFSG